MKNQKNVFWVGINDSETPVRKTKTINGKTNQLWICPMYKTWSAIMIRCYSPVWHIRQPTYIGCTVADEWLKFSVFRKWMILQDWERMAIDKDILFPGNKVYAPDKCIFISQQLNNFLTDRVNHRGEWPLGVTLDKRDGKFQGKCSNPFTGKREALGYFTNPESAHEAWRRRKHEHALRYADMQTDQRIAEALRKRYIN